ncbi:hypothetical protein CYMTET_30143 [Cymbomonas tetramitiformis]|uniref:Uncharacterized protein n=1 Tax=Cymbomonas tetramitiformis TaxID=36881 RepID=A0AAE0FJN2_9CHLO|nr:hypothetical protein CYMTET_30143 [Cymbomonas tetramitiformis]
MDLQLLIRTGSDEERADALKVKPLIENQHLLLVTLLLCNALAMEALPLFLDKVVGPLTAIALSVSLVLVFGEVVPQAVCSKYGLKVGALAAPFVQLLVTVCYPISFPIAKALDALLGNDHIALYRRKEFKALVDMSEEQGLLSYDENTIIDGALDLTSKTVLTAMTPLEEVFMLSEEAVLDASVMEGMMSRGHSRIPIHASGDRQTVIGLLIMKNLIAYDPEDATPVNVLPKRQLISVNTSTEMYGMLRIFKENNSHLALVRSEAGSIMGIITLEDVLEELLQEEIGDETDPSVNSRSAVQRQLWSARLAGVQTKEGRSQDLI